MKQQIIHLKPTVYCKAQTKDAIIHKLTLYPQQLMNTPKALAGRTMEFVLFDGPDMGQPPGSLSEWIKCDNVSLFKVSTEDGDDIIIEHDNGKFIIVKQ